MNVLSQAALLRSAVNSDAEDDFRYSWFDQENSPSAYTVFMKRDKQRLQQIFFGDGKLPPIQNWSQVKQETTAFLCKYLHQDVKVKFVHIRTSDPFVHITDDKWIDNNDFLVVHGDCVVYLAVPNPDLCDRMFNDALKFFGFTINIELHDRELISHHGDDDKRLQYPPSSLNFGISTRPQTYGLIVNKPESLKHSISSAVYPLYQEEFAGVYIQRTTQPTERYHEKRKGCARLCQSFEGKEFHIPVNLKDTYSKKK